MTDSDTPEQTRKPTAPAKQESLLANLLINIIFPALILAKLSGDDWLGTKWAIVVALAFPLLYGLRDFLKTGRANFFSGLGIISILLTGGISLMELDAKYIAIKEAAIQLERTPTALYKAIARVRDSLQICIERSLTRNPNNEPA